VGIWKDKTRTPNRWVYSFQHQGKKYAARGHKTKADARTAMEARRAEVKQQSSAQQTRQDTGFKKIASMYLDYAERKFAEKTYKYKRYVCQQFSAHIGDIEIDVITPQHIHEYLNTRPTNHNYNAHRKDLCALFEFTKKRLRIIDHNPVLDLDKMPHNPRLKHIPTEEQILSLIVAADPNNDERDLILTLLHTLARIDEVLRLTWADVNFEKRAVTLWTRKRKDGNYEADDLPMNDDLYDVLKKRWDGRSQNDWVFFNEKTGTRYKHRPRLMKRLCKRAGIDPPFGFHSIRHFMATFLVDNQKQSKKTISGLLRHQSLQTTEIYLHSVEQSQVDAMDGIAGHFTPKTDEKNAKVLP